MGSKDTGAVGILVLYIRLKERIEHPKEKVRMGYRNF